MTDTAAPDVAPPAMPFSEHDDDRTKAMEHSMVARGESTTEDVIVDYFAFDEENVVVLPDGKQRVFHKTMTEGERRKYQAKSNRDVKVQRATGDAYLKTAPGEDRKALLETVITGWELYKDGKPFPFSKTNVATVLETFPPRVIDIIHKDIMMKNPWLMGEMTLEDIDREMEALTEQRERLVKELAGKDG